MPKCKSCGATIGFELTSSGKQMPVEMGIGKLLVKGEIVEGKIPHWANCPGADTHRKPKPTGTRKRASKNTDPTDEVPF